MTRIASRLVIITLAASAATSTIAEEPGYNPLAIPQSEPPSSIELTVNDEARSRDIPLRIYLPASEKSAPVVFFSHGLGGSRDGNAFMGEHWAARGYAAVFLQHPGSDTSVWQDKPLGQRMSAMREAAGVQNFMLRVADVPAVLNQLDKWNKSEDHRLAGRLDLDHVGMSGHSFGAVTTQAVSGQTFLRGDATFTDPRLRAAIAFSPSTPRRDTAKEAFGDVKIPWMLMTGTEDTALIGEQTVESRLAVFPALPPGDKYEVVLDKAEHSAFTDRALPGDREARNANHHRVILALSTAFWDAYLQDDADAKAWLAGDGPSKLMEKADRWQKK